VMLWVCGGIAVTAALMALAFLPRHAAELDQPQPAVQPSAAAAGRTGAE
jgi:hypothetical protein